MCFVLIDVINSSTMDGVHIYSQDNLAGYGTSNLLEKKYLNELILKYIDSNFLYVESLLMNPLANPSAPDLSGSGFLGSGSGFLGSVFGLRVFCPAIANMLPSCTRIITIKFNKLENMPTSRI